MGYELLKARAQGASHVKSNTPCEDFGLKSESKAGKVFALADGHGDKSCPRSDIGSRRACEIAVNELMVFAEQLAEFDGSFGGGLECSILDYGQVEQEARVRQLIASIIGKWAKDVAANVKDQPLTKEERAGCAKNYLAAYDKGERLEHIFGTTLIAGLATERYILLIQQGDGRCEVFWGDGSVTQPIPWDGRCVANVTTSLCDTDAIPATRYCVIDLLKEEVIAVLVGSDGVEDTFYSMDGTHNFYRDLLVRAANTSVQELEDWLIEYLPEFSSNGLGGYGSQDDVTICGLIDIDRVRFSVEKIKLDTKIVKLKNGLKKDRDRLSSMGSGKLDYLQRQYVKAAAQETKAENEHDAANKALCEFRDSLDGVKKMDGARRLTLSDGINECVLHGRVAREFLNRAERYANREIRKYEQKLPVISSRLEKARKAAKDSLCELNEYKDRRQALIERIENQERELKDLTSSG